MKKYNFSKTWTGEDGKRKVVRADTEGELWEKYYLERYNIEGIREELSESMLNKFLSMRTDDVPTVEEWGTKMIDEVKKHTLSDRWFREYKTMAQSQIFERIGKLKLTEVTREELQEILNTKKDMSNSHISHIFQILTFIFQTAFQSGLIPNNPADYIQKPKGKTKRKSRALRSQERDALLYIFENFGLHYFLFEIMYYTGCRPSEVFRMRNSDIEIINGSLLVHVRGSKTKASDRWVPFPEFLWDKWNQVERSEDELLVKTATGLEFDKWKYKRLSQSLRRAMNISMGAELYRNKVVTDLTKDFKPYYIRHDYCTRLKNAGVDIRTAQYLMGHSNISVTADIYTHTTFDDIVQVSQKIVEGVTGVLPPGEVFLTKSQN